MSFTVYRSSAGSGKTFTLVREYLKILLENPEGFRHILAITFTNKAANEMKERVLGALEELSAYRGDDLSREMPKVMKSLTEEDGMEPEMIVKRSGQALDLILHNYSEFAIGTIDSFSHKLIRTFAHDFKLAGDFNVELDAGEMLATVVGMLLERVGMDNDLTTLLTGFVETRLEEDQNWSIDKTLGEFAFHLLDEEGRVRVSELRNISMADFRRILTELYRQVRIFEQTIRELASGAIRIMDAQGLTAQAFSNSDKGIYSYFRNLSAGRFDKLDPNSNVKKTIEEDKWTSGKATSSEKEAIGRIRDELKTAYERISDEISRSGSHYRLRRMLTRTIYPLAVLNEIEKVLADFRVQKNMIHISEFNARIAMVVMNEPVPFIYERLGEKYRHILIDEFQDTSVLQWMNFIPLIENSLAGGWFNLVVGDGKQAIYRWRSGDVRQFNALPSIPGSEGNPLLKQREQSLTRHFRKPPPLSTNRRSRPVIIDFNNRFFRYIANQSLRGENSGIYADLEQSADPAKKGGYVKIEFLPNEQGAARYEQLTLEGIYRIVLDARSSGFALKDIAVLSRSNKNASGIAAFLLSQGIEVVSAESLLIRNSGKVRFIIAVLRYIFEPPDDVVREEIRTFLSDAGTGAPDDIKKLSAEYSMMPVYDLCERIVRQFDLNRQPDPYLLFFMDEILKFVTGTSYNANDFLDYWERNGRSVSITVPEDLDAVRVMTIHKAKGLQFPLVILPFANETRSNTKEYLWVDLDEEVAPGLHHALLKTGKEMELTPYIHLYREEQERSMLDLVNLLYVAMTRPVEQLYVMTTEPKTMSEVPDSLPRFFKGYLTSENLWNDDQKEYLFGTPESGQPGGSKGNAVPVILNETISADWRDRVVIKPHAPFAWDPEDPSARNEFGNIMHTLLSWIRTPDDLQPALKRAVQSGLIPEEDSGRYHSRLQTLVEHPSLRTLFDGAADLRTEAEILIPSGSFSRPDRVVIRGNQAILAEYKTGAHRSQNAIQVARYAGLIREMGYAQVKCFLIYLEPEIEIIEVEL